MIRGRHAAVAVIVLLAAACGGGATPSSGPTAATSQGAGSSQAAASNTPVTAAPSQGASASTGGGGGGGAADACALLTAEEVGSVLDAAGTTSEGTPGEVSYCMYRSAAGDILAATSYIKQGGRQAYDVWSSASDTIPVDGIGDDATFDPNSATLFIVVGERLVGLTAGDGSASENDRLSWARELGAFVASRA